MEPSEFHDHSTMWGKLAVYFKRINWQWVLVGTAVCTIFAIWAISQNKSQSTPLLQHGILLAGESEKLEASDAFSNGIYNFQGAADRSTVFEGFPEYIDAGSIEHVTISRSYIDGELLTASLVPLVNLQSLSIETLGFVGPVDKFTRVYLPHLKDFKFNYLPHINADVYKHPEILHKLLFFDQIQYKYWDFEKDVLNLGINITVVIDGTILLDINRPLGRLNINVHFCQRVLKNVKGPYNKLILSWCPFSNASLVAPSVKYLNLNNALLSPAEFSRLIKGLHQLEEFHAFQPYLGNDDQAQRFYWLQAEPFCQIPINLNDFSKSVKTLSLSRLALTVSSRENSNLAGISSNIQDLSLEESNVTAEVLDNFKIIFPRLVTARLFNLKEMTGVEVGTPSKLLYQVLQTPALKIVVTGYERGNVRNNYSQFIEEFLSSNNLAKDETSFLILRNNTPDTNFGGNPNLKDTTERTGPTLVRSLTLLEKNYKRFESMGFQDIDTFEDYLIYDSVYHNGAASQFNSTFPILRILISFIIVFSSIVNRCM